MSPRRYVIKGEARTVKCADCYHCEHHGNRSGVCGLSGRYVADMFRRTLCNGYEEEAK